MDKKKLIITVLIIIIISVLFIILIRLNKTKTLNKEKNNNSLSQISEVTNMKKSKEALKDSLEISKTFYKEDKDFYTYFKTDFIDGHLQDYNLIFVDNINQIDFGLYEIFGIDGKKIEKFPYEKVNNISRDNLVIEPDQDCIIKIYSNLEETAYYFILNISKDGEYKLTDLCYTVGEMMNLDSGMS